MNASPLPTGQVRISDAVLDKLVLTALYDVHGVVDVQGMALGAFLGGAVGGMVGFAQAGPVGAAVGGTLGVAAGSAAGHALAEAHDRRLYYGSGEPPPPLSLRLTARYGAPLEAVADEVRSRIRQAIREAAGLELGPIDVSFVEVAP